MAERRKKVRINFQVDEVHELLKGSHYGRTIGTQITKVVAIWAVYQVKKGKIKKLKSRKIR